MLRLLIAMNHGHNSRRYNSNLKLTKMKQLFFLFAILFALGVSSSVDAQTKLPDGVPITVMDEDSIITDTASTVTLKTSWDATWSVEAAATQESGTADALVILQATNDGVNWFSTGDTITLSGTSNQSMTGTALPYYVYRIYYDEQTAAGVDLLITFLARKRTTK